MGDQLGRFLGDLTIRSGPHTLPIEILVGIEKDPEERAGEKEMANDWSLWVLQQMEWNPWNP